MQAVQWFGPRDIQVHTLPLPERHMARDAVVRITRAAICGTDLHPYRGEIPDFLVGTVMGHEFTGIIEDIDPAITHLRCGDRVVASDVIACGKCWYCQRDWHYQCVHVSLFGYGTVVGTYVPGGQAEFVRVPFADVVLTKIPDSLTDEQALFVGDILTTGFMSAEAAQIQPGTTVAVVGCGPVGLFAIQSAYVLGASRVLAIDPDPQRQAAAQRVGAYTVSYEGDVIEQVRSLTSGRGADAVVEAVGSEAALTSALAMARPRGNIVVVGAHQAEAMPFSTRSAFGRELTLKFVVGDPISARDRIIALLEAGRLDPTQIISHRLPLAQAKAAYALFDRREAIKVVLLPEAPLAYTEAPHVV
jgi:2-desacetyl-2-hydroxyethyl bacteriochlorophyllide A dehydrogenase